MKMMRLFQLLLVLTTTRRLSKAATVITPIPRPASDQATSPKPTNAITMMDCINAFGALRFDLVDYGKYDTYFGGGNLSKIVLAQAGEYIGRDSIEEYVRFLDETSPYILTSKTLSSTSMFKSVDPVAGTCTFLSHRVARQEFNPKLAKEATCDFGILSQVTYNFDGAYVSKVHVYFTPEFLSFFFDALDTDRTRRFICEVSERDCPDINPNLTQTECMDRLRALPMTTGNAGNVDGNSYGCRSLHSVFARVNKDHCAHISFEPQEDSEGNIKCQTSRGIRPKDLFDPEDIQSFRDFAEDSSIGSRSGLEILSQPRNMDPTSQALVAVLVPLVIFGLVYFGMGSEAAPQEDDTKQNALMANKARQLFLIFGMIGTTLMVVFGLAGLGIWALGRSNPDWTEETVERPRNNYIGEHTAVSDTVPHSLMDDEQFQIYTGFVIWGTCLISGLGLEVFVWYHFLQVWTQRTEGLWRFAQFSFPLMGLCAVGFGFSHSFWALPFIVLGHFKFGFPEILMYLYMGLFATANRPLRRLSDLLNGLGSILHHAASCMIVSMSVVGVIPFSRYVLNCAMLLLMQHWFALLAYNNLRLYSAIELVLEFYFEWIVLAEFPQLYKDHWTAALAASVMLFAHWMYLVAAGLGQATGQEKGDGDETNVHRRGSAEILKVPDNLSRDMTDSFTVDLGDSSREAPRPVDEDEEYMIITGGKKPTERGDSQRSILSQSRDLARVSRPTPGSQHNMVNSWGSRSVVGSQRNLASLAADFLHQQCSQEPIMSSECRSMLQLVTPRDHATPRRGTVSFVESPST